MKIRKTPLKLTHAFSIILPQKGNNLGYSYWLVYTGSGGSLDGFTYDSVEINGEWKCHVHPFIKATEICVEALGVEKGQLVAGIRWTDRLQVVSEDASWERHLERLEREQDTDGIPAEDLEDAAAVQRDDADDLARATEAEAGLTRAKTNRLLTLNHSYTLIAPAAGWERQVGYWLVASDRVAGLFASMGKLDWNTIEIDGEWSFRIDPFVRAGDEPRLGGDPATFGISPDTLIANVRFTTGCGGRVRSADDFERYVETLEEAPDRPRILISYDIVTPESAEDGDVAESGWEDAEGIDCRPDELDDIDSCGETTVDKAVAFLEGKCLDSGSDGTTYYEADGTTDYRTGENTRLAFHLEGFTDAEIETIGYVIND